jgi:hypothetical protein
MASRFVCEELEGPSRAGDLFTSADVPWPEARPLNVYAFDPSLGKFVGNYMTASVRFEQLQPGPIGERFAVHRLRRQQQDLLIGPH